MTLSVIVWQSVSRSELHSERRGGGPPPDYIALFTYALGWRVWHEVPCTFESDAHDSELLRTEGCRKHEGGVEVCLPHRMLGMLLPT